MKLKKGRNRKIWMKVEKEKKKIERGWDGKDKKCKNEIEWIKGEGGGGRGVGREAQASVSLRFIFVFRK